MATGLRVRGQAQGLPLPEIEGWGDETTRMGVPGQSQGLTIPEVEGWDGVGDA